MIRARVDEVFFIEPYHSALFIMTIDKEGYVDVDEHLFCLHFKVQHLPLLFVEREEYDEDMDLKRTIYQRPQYSIQSCHYRITPSYYIFQSLGGPSSLPHHSILKLGSLSSFERNVKSIKKIGLSMVVKNFDREVYYSSSNTKYDSEDNLNCDALDGVEIECSQLKLDKERSYLEGVRANAQCAI